jgi:site-specific DNA-methyltransferase (cytosine-N4-specific)
MYCGEAERLLEQYPVTRRREKVQLIFTSPPFPLNRKKRYGNRNGDDYVKWLANFAGQLGDYLAPTGSIVIELGNAWEPRRPTMSTLPLQALLAFQEKGEFHLCQEFICFNPARLPSPAQWVTVDRIRVKDAFTRLWWLSPSERPKADNRRVLTAYSESMAKLLERGTYNPGYRPSEHHIGKTSFLRDNGGAIPPSVLSLAVADMLSDPTNVLPTANTRSDDPYLRYCRSRQIQPHPARMPAKLAAFFVEFLTEPGDLVLDPFAGSNVTGFVADELGRRWVSIEADTRYADASRFRFQRPRSAAR